jgi:hypothetical protein
MIALTILMVSQVRYAMLPRVGLRSAQGLLGLVTNLSILIFGIWQHDLFFFPLGIVYMTYGVVRAALFGLFEGPENQATAVAGPMVMHDDDRLADAYGQRRRGITPRARPPESSGPSGMTGGQS